MRKPRRSGARTAGVNAEGGRRAQHAAFMITGAIWALAGCSTSVYEDLRSSDTFSLGPGGPGVADCGSSSLPSRPLLGVVNVERVPSTRATITATPLTRGPGAALSITGRPHHRCSFTRGLHGMGHSRALDQGDTYTLQVFL